MSGSGLSTLLGSGLWALGFGITQSLKPKAESLARAYDRPNSFPVEPEELPPNELPELLLPPEFELPEL